MEWTSSLRGAISYIEEHLLEDIRAEDVALAVYVSPFYLQKGFRILTGYSMGEYIRCRRLYLAALELRSGADKIAELAVKYGYDTPDSFTKAFRRFHGVSPMGFKKGGGTIKPFLPLKITLQVQGGYNMDMTFETMKGFTVIGFSHKVSFDSAYERIPALWDKFSEEYLAPLFAKGRPENATERVICSCMIGELGICIDDAQESGSFHYMIAGRYCGGGVPAGMTLYEIPEMEWAKFRCVGSMPGALQSVNTKIFQEWLPGNERYEIAAGLNIEWYSQGDVSAPDYESAIWIPIVRKR